MTEIIREIDEELQAKHYTTLAKKYGKYIAGVVLLIALSFGGYGFWESRQQAAMEARAAEFTALMAQTSPAESWSAFASARNDSFSLMAWRFAAAEHLRNQQFAEAQNILQALSEQGGQSAGYRDFAASMAQIAALNAGGEVEAPVQAEKSFTAFAALAEAERLLASGDRKAAIEVLQSALQNTDTQNISQEDAALQTLFSELIGALQSTR